MKDLRSINPRARPGEFYHDDEAVLLAALWLRRHRNAIDLAVVRDLRVRFGITTAQAAQALRISNSGGAGG